MTLGVRIVVTDSRDRVLLVRHSYVPGWHLPGGGVERRETAEEAARKELLEETAIEATGPFELIGFFANRQASPRDHVVLYRIRQWNQTKPFEATSEILETGFFALEELPDSTTSSTRQRLAELKGESLIRPFW